MGTLSHIMDDGVLLNFHTSSGYLLINSYNVLISFPAEKPWLKGLSKSMENEESDEWCYLQIVLLL